METLKKLVNYRLKQDEVKKELKLIRQEIYQTQAQQETAKIQSNNVVFSEKFYKQKMTRLLSLLKSKSEEGQVLYTTIKGYQNSKTVKVLKHIDTHGVYYIIGIMILSGFLFYNF